MMSAATTTRPSLGARAAFAGSIRKVAARRRQLVDPPTFDRHRFAAVAAQIEQALATDDEIRARGLIEGWERVELDELGRT